MSAQHHLPDSTSANPLVRFFQALVSGAAMVGSVLLFVFVILPVVGAILLALLAVGLVLALVLGAVAWWKLRSFRKRAERHFQDQSGQSRDREEPTHTGPGGRPSRRVDVKIHKD